MLAPTDLLPPSASAPLVCLIPRPRTHMLRYHGVMSPSSPMRKRLDGGSWLESGYPFHRCRSLGRTRLRGWPGLVAARTTGGVVEDGGTGVGVLVSLSMLPITQYISQKFPSYTDSFKKRGDPSAKPPKVSHPIHQALHNLRLERNRIQIRNHLRFHSRLLDF